MKINNIKATDYRIRDNILELDLICNIDEALAIDTTVIKVTTDQNDLVEQFIGYVKLSAMIDIVTNKVILKCFKDKDNVTQILSSMAETNESKHDEIMLAIAELGSLVATISNQEK